VSGAACVRANLAHEDVFGLICPLRQRPEMEIMCRKSVPRGFCSYSLCWTFMNVVLSFRLDRGLFGLIYRCIFFWIFLFLLVKPSGFSRRSSSETKTMKAC
jgi:hypothetical protein